MRIILHNLLLHPRLSPMLINHIHSNRIHPNQRLPAMPTRLQNLYISFLSLQQLCINLLHEHNTVKMPTMHSHVLRHM